MGDLRPCFVLCEKNMGLTFLHVLDQVLVACGLLSSGVHCRGVHWPRITAVSERLFYIDIEEFGQLGSVQPTACAWSHAGRGDGWVLAAGTHRDVPPSATAVDATEIPQGCAEASLLALAAYSSGRG